MNCFWVILNMSLEEAEAKHIQNVLNNVEGNKTKAAEVLRIDRKTLRKKLEILNPEP